MEDPKRILTVDLEGLPPRAARAIQRLSEASEDLATALDQRLQEQDASAKAQAQAIKDVEKQVEALDRTRADLRSAALSVVAFARRHPRLSQAIAGLILTGAALFVESVGHYVERINPYSDQQGRCPEEPKP